MLGQFFDNGKVQIPNIIIKILENKSMGDKSNREMFQQGTNNIFLVISIDNFLNSINEHFKIYM